MKKPRRNPWAKTIARSAKALTRQALKTGRQLLSQSVAQAAKPVLARAQARRAPAGGGSWLPGVALGAAGARRWRLFSPAGRAFGERLPLVVMLHGCTQEAHSFATSTRMNQLAARERFLVLYPEQDRLANAQGCWNWYDTDHGRAQAEVALVLRAIDQVCLGHGADHQRVLLAGLSAGASLAALLATQHPARFAGLVMHSGIPPGTAHSTLTALGAMQGRRRTAPPAATAAGAGWPPLLVIHGSADAVVSPQNGEAAVRLWAEATGARASAPRRLQRGRRHVMLVTDHQRAGRSLATLALVQGLGHAWSGGAAGQPFSDPQGPDASRLVWAFAQKQFRRQPA